MVRTLSLLITAALAVGTLAAAAFAQSAAPAPGCQGMQVTDPPGDSAVEGADVTGAWFDTSAGKVTANIAVKDLAEPTGSSPTQLRWYMVWTLGETQHFVRASSDGTFAGGELTDTGYSTVEQTLVGKFFAGPDGVIQIQVPGGRAGRGKKLEAPYLEVKQAVGNSSAALLVADPDRAPDEGEGQPYTVQDCSAAGAPGDTAQPPANHPQADALAVSAPSKLKRPKAKKLVVKLRSSGRVTDLEAAFGKGSKTLGRGRLASLEGKGKLVIRLSRKLKRGSYTLYVRGRNSDGSSADKTFKIKVR